MQTISRMLDNLIMHQRQQRKSPSSMFFLLESPKAQRFFDITHHALAFDALLSQALINSSILFREVIDQKQWGDFITQWVEIVEHENSVVLQLTKGVELAQLKQVNQRWLLTDLLAIKMGQCPQSQALVSELKKYYSPV